MALRIIAILVASITLSNAFPYSQATSNASCIPARLVNSGFESGSIIPWDFSPEGAATATITKSAYSGHYAVNFTNTYGGTPSPVIYFGQYLNFCGVTQSLTFRYKIEPHPHRRNLLGVELYGGSQKHLYIDKIIFFGPNKTTDSLGHPKGDWQVAGPYKFTPTDDRLVFAFTFDGDLGSANGSTTVLLDDVLFTAHP